MVLEPVVDSDNRVVSPNRDEALVDAPGTVALPVLTVGSTEPSRVVGGSALAGSGLAAGYLDAAVPGTTTGAPVDPEVVALSPDEPVDSSAESLDDPGGVELDDPPTATVETRRITWGVDSEVFASVSLASVGAPGVSGVSVEAPAAPDFAWVSVIDQSCS
jgi:hypothetical protein